MQSVIKEHNVPWGLFVIICKKIYSLGKRLGCPLSRNLDKTELSTVNKVSLIVQYFPSVSSGKKELLTA